MPEGLLKAHLNNDVAVEKCYNININKDENKLLHLFDLYEKTNNKDILI